MSDEKLYDMYRSVDSKLNAEQKAKSARDVASLMYKFKRDLGETLAQERGYADYQAMCFVEGFSGIPIHVSNPRSVGCVAEYKEGKGLLQDKNIRETLDKKEAEFIRQCNPKTYKASLSY